MARLSVVRSQVGKNVLGIRSGIPLPPARHPSVTRDQLRACAVGDSFTTKLRRSVVYYHASKLGIKIACRPLGNGEMGVWRTA